MLTGASPDLFLQNNAATLKFAGATPSDMRMTAIMPICDSSTGVKLGSSRGPTSSDPPFLDGTTSSIRLHSAVLGLTFLALLAADASLALLAAGAFSLPHPDPPGPPRPLWPLHVVLLPKRFEHCCPTSSFIIACLICSRHPSLCGFASAQLRHTASLKVVGDSVLHEPHFSPDAETTSSVLPRIHGWNCQSVFDWNRLAPQPRWIRLP